MFIGIYEKFGNKWFLYLHHQHIYKDMGLENFLHLVTCLLKQYQKNVGGLCVAFRECGKMPILYIINNVSRLYVALQTCHQIRIIGLISRMSLIPNAAMPYDELHNSREMSG